MMLAFPIYILIRLVGFFINLLPERFALSIGRQLGNLMYYVDLEHRRVAMDNLKIAFGEEKTEAERYSIARKNFQNLGMMAIEFFLIP